MSEFKDCTCASCGYQWRLGKDGSHSCAEHLRKRLNQVEADANRYRWLKKVGAPNLRMIAWGSRAACSMSAENDDSDLDFVIDAAIEARDHINEKTQ